MAEGRLRGHLARVSWLMGIPSRSMSSSPHSATPLRLTRPSLRPLSSSLRRTRSSLINTLAHSKNISWIRSPILPLQLLIMGSAPYAGARQDALACTVYA
jgi:hypothetical protein